MIAWNQHDFLLRPSNETVICAAKARSEKVSFALKRRKRQKIITVGGFHEKRRGGMFDSSYFDNSKVTYFNC